MGITGLIPFLEKASSKVNLKDLKGSTVAVDTYCWLHKGVFSCADKLARGEETDLYIQFCLKYVHMLLSFDIKPILVFDGQHLPAKALTEKRRRDQRNQAKKRAAELLRQGKTEEARAQMRRCIDVTHEMALRLIKECRLRNVDCIVAPYEADAQMAWLNKVDLAQYVITEDSDLTLFGAKKIIFKLDLNGNGLLVEADKLHLAMGCRLEKYNFDKFRRMCIMSGCDYLDSLPGIGLAKACKFILLTEENNMMIALKKIPQYLKMKNITVDNEYIESFLKAEATFKHMFIYNPLKRRMERLNDLKDSDIDEKYLCNAGHCLDDEDKAFNLALGNLNPFSLKELDSWNPDSCDSLPQVPGKNIKRAKHPSIWQNNFYQQKVQMEFKSALFFKKVDFNSQSVEEEIREKIAEENAKPHEAEIFSLYKFGFQQQATLAKRKRSPSEDEQEENLDDADEIREMKPPPLSPAPNKSRHNPFAKIPSNQNEIDLQKSPKVCENSSLLKVLSPKKSKEDFKQLPSTTNSSKLSSLKRNIFLEVTEKVEVKSRFFASNLKRIKHTPPMTPMTPSTPPTPTKSSASSVMSNSESCKLSQEITKLDYQSQVKQEQQMLLYCESPSPRKKSPSSCTAAMLSNEFIAPSHTDSGLDSIASDTLYQQDDALQTQTTATPTMTTPVKAEKQNEDSPKSALKCEPDEAIVLSDSDSWGSSQTSSSSQWTSSSNLKAKTANTTPLGTGLSKGKASASSAKKSTKAVPKINTKPVSSAQMRLSAFGFQKRPTLK